MDFVLWRLNHIEDSYLILRAKVELHDLTQLEHSLLNDALLLLQLLRGE